MSQDREMQEALTHTVGITGRPEPTVYLVMSDVSHKMILTTDDYREAVRTATMIRRAGGQVTIFKSLKA